MHLYRAKHKKKYNPMAFLDWTKRSDASFFQKPSVYHALIGFLSFLAAPLVGALSDVFGRKTFLLVTVFFTCSPIPFMHVSHWWYFTLITVSGIFSVTFSVVFAYVSDVTTEEDRSWAYGLVSASFAASLITSPAIGAHLGKLYSDNFVVALATFVALLDIFFILTVVPESLSEKNRCVAWGSQISWAKADPFSSLRKMGADQLILMLCITTFLSYLPEAGEYTCFFVYLRLIMGFSEEGVAYFICVVGILSCIAQTAGLSFLIKHCGPKRTIMIGLVFHMLQMGIYGFSSQTFLLWLAGCLAALGSITYPAISAFVSNHAEQDQQGVAQGILTGIRGLCNGLGPALFGFIFYVFEVDLNDAPKMASSPLIPGLAGAANRTAAATVASAGVTALSWQQRMHNFNKAIMPGPPFAFGAVLVLLAILVSVLIPDNPHSSINISVKPGDGHRRTPSLVINYHRLAIDDDDPEQQAATSATSAATAGSSSAGAGASSSS
uniref:MFS domain-containing protein n=1 Tax=Macrostomum lignano TaxID=282301 RepID=A0A1I8FYS5_9PLAT